MARTQEVEQFDYASAPKGRENFPKSYMNVHFVTAEKRIGDDGLAYFYAQGEVTAPHADGTEDFDGHPVNLFFRVGTEDCPEADTADGWAAIDTKGMNDEERKLAQRHDIAVRECINLLKAAKLTKAEGKSVAPWVLFNDLEGEDVCINFGENKNGYQTYTFYEVGKREPMVVGHRSARKREADAPPSRAGNGRDREREPVDEPEPPRRARR